MGFGKVKTESMDDTTDTSMEFKPPSSTTAFLNFLRLSHLRGLYGRGHANKYRKKIPSATAKRIKKELSKNPKSPKTTNPKDTSNNNFHCLVPDCVGKCVSFSCEPALRRHWREKHEPIVAQFRCAVCGSLSKRRENSVAHVRMVHTDLSFGDCSFHVEAEKTINVDFIDPFPLTWHCISSQQRKVPAVKVDKTDTSENTTGLTEKTDWMETSLSEKTESESMTASVSEPQEEST